MEEIKLIEQALNIATKNGVYNLEDCSRLHTSLKQLKKSYEFYQTEYDNSRQEKISNDKELNKPKKK